MAVATTSADIEVLIDRALTATVTAECMLLCVAGGRARSRPGGIDSSRDFADDGAMDGAGTF